MKTWGVLILSLFISPIIFGQINISGKVYNSGNMAIFGDVNFNKAQIINSTGNISLVAVKNAHQVNINQSNINGALEITGDYRTLFEVGNSCHLEDLIINKKNLSDVYVFGDSIVINKSLNLLQGRIFNDEAILQVANTEKNSIQFTDKSYIVGKIQRKTSKGVEYELPVGDDANIHLMTITDNVFANNTFQTGFTRGLPAELRSTILQLSRRGHWEISAEKSAACDVTSYYDNMDLFSNESPNFLKVAEKDDGTYEQKLLNIISVDYNKLSLKVNTDITNKPAKYLVAEHTDDNSAWINFIDLKGSDTRFRVKGINQKYTNVKITIYNSWGRKVFQSDNYQEEFDALNYPPGTYFYRACYTLYGDGEEICKNSFFEVKD